MVKRFIKFTMGTLPDGWSLVSLDRLTSKITDIDHNMPEKMTDGFPFISINHINKSESPLFDFERYNCEYIHERDYSHHSKRFNTQIDDIIFSRFGTIGIAKLIKTSKSFIASYSIVLIKPVKELISPLYLTYFLNSIPLRNQALVYTQGSTNQNLHLADIRNLLIALPDSIEEHEEISDVLLKVDEAIEKTDFIIRQTQQLKKGLMQKLFAEGIGHTRFKKTILADVAKPIAQRGHQLEQFRILPQDWDIVGCDKVFSLEYGKGLTESERDCGDFPVVGSAGIVGHHSRKLVVGPGMVVGRKGGAGIVTYLKDDFWAIDTTYFVKLKGKHDVDWLYYILNFLNLTRLGEGTVPGLNRTDVYHLYIPAPSLPEQRQIADILSEVDTKIETEQAYKAELEQLKKGLMQVLLTGKVRVKV